MRPWFLLGALPAAAGTVQASGFHTAEFHTAYVGQATAGVTLTENAGVVAQLPAGMVRLDEGNHALGGFNQYVPKFDYTATNSGETGSTTTDPITGPFAYAVHNAGKWAAGAGLYFPFNVVIQYPDNWAGRSILTKEEVNVGYFALTGAYALNDDLSFGLAVNFIGSRVRLQQTQVVAPGTEVPTTLGGTTENLGGQFSLLYDQEHWRLALAHSPKYTISGEGNAQFDTSANPSLTSTFPDGGVKVTLLMPSVTELGVAWKDQRKDPDNSVELGILRTGWSNFSEIHIQFTSGKPQPDVVLPRRWKDTTGVKVGGYHVLSRSGTVSHRIRAGVYVDQSPIPADTLEPGVPDGAGRNEFAVGYGYRSGNLSAEAAVFQINFKDSQTGGDNPFPAKYGGAVTIYSFDLGYKF